MKIAVVGNCNAPGIADALMHLIPDAEILSMEISAMRNAGRTEEALRLVEGSEVLLYHFASSEEGEFGSDKLSLRCPRSCRIPSFSFTGFHPDCTYLEKDGKNYQSPLGGYHSAIAAASFSMGLSQQDSIALFNAYVFKKLGYMDEYDKACVFLRNYMTELGYELSIEWSSWESRAPFMHTVNHPTVDVIASIAKLVAIKAGLVAADVVTPRVPYDWLSSANIWPVYPEIARARGITGSYLFKRAGGSSIFGESSVFMNLERFIDGSFAAYSTYPMEAFTGENILRIRRILESLLNLPSRA